VESARHLGGRGGGARAPVRLFLSLSFPRPGPFLRRRNPGSSEARRPGALSDRESGTRSKGEPAGGTPAGGRGNATPKKTFFFLSFSYRQQVVVKLVHLVPQAGHQAHARNDDPHPLAVRRRGSAGGDEEAAGRWNDRAAGGEQESGWPGAGGRAAGGLKKGRDDIV